MVSSINSSSDMEFEKVVVLVLMHEKFRNKEMRDLDRSPDEFTVGTLHILHGI